MSNRENAREQALVKYLHATSGGNSRSDFTRFVRPCWKRGRLSYQTTTTELSTWFLGLAAANHWKLAHSRVGSEAQIGAEHISHKVARVLRQACVVIMIRQIKVN